jgi:serine-type D-Ala-D-Ala carboxypeptidase/endopeptidase (penicillin-binding protein 4)
VRGLLSVWLGVALALELVWPARAQATARDSAQSAALADALDAIFDDPRLDGVVVGVAVRSATTGELLYDRGGDRRLPPASNQKLITSTTALADLGPDFRFLTSVLASEAPRDGMLTGDLYLRGGGDPTLVPARFDELAAAVATRGVVEVHGRLVADDTWFDSVRLGTDWSTQDETFAYAAPISALSLAPDADFNTGSVQVDILPGPTAGAPARVGLTPPTRSIQVENHLLTGPPGSPRRLFAMREHGTNRIVVSGTMPLDGRPAHPLESVDDPTAYAADIFAAALARHGVRLTDSAASKGPTPSTAVELASVESMPLRDLLAPLLKFSNNPMAEMLVKTIGRHDADRGTWDAGLDVLRRFLATESVDPSRVQLVDGSGLSTSNLIAPDDLTALLVAVRAEPWFDSWYAALPIAGESDRSIGGTLAERMQATPAAGNVHAKTGSLTTASALSGYVTTAAGEPLTFSILEDGFIGAPPKDIEDALAVTLASFSDCLADCS